MVVYNPFDHAIVDDVYAVYRQLRDEAPVYYNPDVDFWALSRFDDVMNAHLDPATFSSTHGVTIEGIDSGRPFLIVKDPPEHTWRRKVVSRVFNPRRIGVMEDFIRTTAADLLDRHVDGDGFDVVTEFSFRLPLDVIGALIDIPAELRIEVHESRTSSLHAMVRRSVPMRRPRPAPRSYRSSAASSPSGGGGQVTMSSACLCKPRLRTTPEPIA
jgi:cytochrome P450